MTAIDESYLDKLLNSVSSDATTRTIESLSSRKNGSNKAETLISKEKDVSGFVAPKDRKKKEREAKKNEKREKIAAKKIEKELADKEKREKREKKKQQKQNKKNDRDYLKSADDLIKDIGMSGKGSEKDNSVSAIDIIKNSLYKKREKVQNETEKKIMSKEGLDLDLSSGPQLDDYSIFEDFDESEIDKAISQELSASGKDTYEDTYEDSFETSVEQPKKVTKSVKETSKEPVKKPVKEKAVETIKQPVKTSKEDDLFADELAKSLSEEVGAFIDDEKKAERDRANESGPEEVSAEGSLDALFSMSDDVKDDIPEDMPSSYIVDNDEPEESGSKMTSEEKDEFMAGLMPDFVATGDESYDDVPEEGSSKNKSVDDLLFSLGEGKLDDDLEKLLESDNDETDRLIDEAVKPLKQKAPKEKKKLDFVGVLTKLFANVPVDPSKVKKELTPEEIEAKKAAAAEKKQALSEARKAEKAAKAEVSKKLKDEKVRLALAEKEAKREEKLKRAKLILEENEGTQINRAGASIVFLFFGLIAVIIISASNVFTYSVSVSDARKNFKYALATKNVDYYTEAYNEIVGMELKDEDKQFGEDLYVVMFINRYLTAYDSYMTMGNESEALNALLMGAYRYGRYTASDAYARIAPHIDNVGDQIYGILNEKYGISRDEADQISRKVGSFYLDDLPKLKRLEVQRDYSQFVYETVEKLKK